MVRRDENASRDVHAVVKFGSSRWTRHRRAALASRPDLGGRSKQTRAQEARVDGNLIDRIVSAVHDNRKCCPSPIPT